MEKLLLVQASACIAESVTYPLDYIKTMIQINKKRSIIPVLKSVYKNPTVYNGLKPSLIRHCIYTSSRINIYEHFRDNTNLNRFIIGGLSGCISQLIASPFDLLKINYITNSSLNNNSIVNNISMIYKKNGFTGLYRGCFPNVMRASLVNLGEIATYDLVKTNLKKKYKFNDNYKLHISSSIVSGFVSSLLCTPADVIKSRMMQYNNTQTLIDCTYSIIKNEGIYAFYKGFIPIWFRLAPWQLTFWVSYEQSRNIFNIQSF